ncbi:hypothetical protein GOP47_0029431, partial [Adiantum capillus-veneris]
WSQKDSLLIFEEYTYIECASIPAQRGKQGEASTLISTPLPPFVKLHQEDCPKFNVKRFEKDLTGLLWHFTLPMWNAHLLFLDDVHRYCFDSFSIVTMERLLSSVFRYCLQQPNATDCGYYVMTAMRLLIKTTFKDKKPQLNLLKKDWFGHEEVDFTRKKINEWLHKQLGEVIV